MQILSLATRQEIGSIFLEGKAIGSMIAYKTLHDNLGAIAATSRGRNQGQFYSDP